LLLRDPDGTQLELLFATALARVDRPARSTDLYNPAV